MTETVSSQLAELHGENLDDAELLRAMCRAFRVDAERVDIATMLGVLEVMQEQEPLPAAVYSDLRQTIAGFADGDLSASVVALPVTADTGGVHAERADTDSADTDSAEADSAARAGDVNPAPATAPSGPASEAESPVVEPAAAQVAGVPLMLNGRYELQAEIEDRGPSKLYRALDRSLSAATANDVAVEVWLPPRTVDAGVEELLAPGQPMEAPLRHLNLAVERELALAGSVLYRATDYLGGGPLSAMIGRTMAPERAPVSH